MGEDTLYDLLQHYVQAAREGAQRDGERRVVYVGTLHDGETALRIGAAGVEVAEPCS